jgi:hypothetical protein
VNLTDTLQFDWTSPGILSYPEPVPNSWEFYDYVLVTKFDASGHAYTVWELQFDQLAYLSALQSWETARAAYEAKQVSDNLAAERAAIAEYNLHMAFIAHVNTANEFVVSRPPMKALHWSEKHRSRKSDTKGSDAVEYRAFLQLMNQTVGREMFEILSAFYHSLYFDERAYFREHPEMVTAPRGLIYKTVKTVFGQRRVLVPVSMRYAKMYFRMGYLRLDSSVFIRNVVTDQIEDRFIGEMQARARRLYRSGLTTRPVGASYGPAM